MPIRCYRHSLPTRSPPERWLNAPRRSSRSWWKTARTPGRRASISILNAAAPSLSAFATTAAASARTIWHWRWRGTPPVKSARSTTGGDRQPRFRGEALASISSVSRLTLTSRTADQSEAWQAYAEGREQAVTVKPAAHPVGSTLEVLDLFYNTPARRKFMRTEKTEFGHIDEVVRRIALARFDVAINLSHNGKLIRQYRAAKEESQHERRLGSICGPAFCSMR